MHLSIVCESVFRLVNLSASSESETARTTGPKLRSLRSRNDYKPTESVLLRGGSEEKVVRFWFFENLFTSYFLLSFTAFFRFFSQNNSNFPNFQTESMTNGTVENTQNERL